MRPLIPLLGCLAWLSLAGPAHAQSIQSCSDAYQANAIFQIEPWEEHTRLIADGRVRLTWMDTFGEPVGGSSWLMVIMPDELEPVGDPIAAISCYLVGGPGYGFNGILFDEISIDPGHITTVEVPVSLFDPQTSDTRRDILLLSINLLQETLTANHGGRVSRARIDEDLGLVIE